jgi:hypothetical protein
MHVLYVCNKFGILHVGTCNNKLFIKWDYLDPQILMRTNLHTSRQEVVAYFTKAMRYYRDKEMLVVLFNMGSHLVTLLISTKYDQVWYCDSSRPTDPITGEQLTRDWTDVIPFLRSKFLLHFIF